MAPKRKILISDEPEIDLTPEYTAKEKKKEKVKKFLAAMITKRKAKKEKEDFWKPFLQTYGSKYSLSILRGSDKNYKLPSLNAGKHVGIRGVEQGKLVAFCVLGSYLLVKGYSIYKNNFPKPSKEPFHVGFVHPDVASLITGNPHFDGASASSVLKEPVQKDLYDNNQYSVFYDLVYSFDIEKNKKTGFFEAERCDGGRIMLAVRYNSTQPYEDHIAITLLTTKEEIDENDGYPITIHYRTEFGRSDDPEKDKIIEKYLRQDLKSYNPWLRDYAKSVGLIWV